MSASATYLAAALRVVARDVIWGNHVAMLRLHEGANELERLAAEVEKMRMSEKEREAIADCADAAEAYMNDDIAATLRALNDRHARETVGG
jgi:hypothetical protein